MRENVEHTITDIGDGSFPIPRSRAERRAMTAAAVKAGDWPRVHQLKTAGMVYKVHSRPANGRWHESKREN